MPQTEKDRKRYRRQRRRRKVRELRARLAETTDAKTRKRLLTKIQRLAPWAEVPEQ